MDNSFKNFNGITNYGINLTEEDINRLKPRCWLNDNIINYYLHLLISNSKIQSLNFESYFYTSLDQRRFLSVDNWYKRTNIFSYDLIYIPININTNHWILATIENFKCKVTVYDSFKNNQSRVLNNIKYYLNAKYLQFFGVQLTNHWEFVQEYDLPLQKNTYDCGVFVCKIAHLKSLKYDYMDFLARDMDYYRKNILLSILSSKIF